MTVTLAHILNPLTPEVGLSTFSAHEGESVEAAIMRAGWKLPASTVLVRQGVQLSSVDWKTVDLREILVPRSEWDKTPVNDDDVAVLVTLPQGGGGASNPLAIIAQIALIVLAAAVAGPWGVGAALAADIGVSVAIGTAIVSSAILIGGKLLLSAVLPQPKQSVAPAASPTYDLNAQQNLARLGGAIPEWFGFFNFVLDLASQPYLDYAGNNQTLYELFVLGRGVYQIHEIRIGTNVIARDNDGDGNLTATGTYPEISWEIVQPGDAPTLFPDNIDTSADVSAIELLATDEDNHDWTAWFVCNPPGTTTTEIFIDIALPEGLYANDSSGKNYPDTVTFTVQTQQIDDDGNTIGDENNALEVTLQLNTPTPQRITYPAKVAKGRYQSRAIRTNTRGNPQKRHTTLIWLALRAFLPTVTNFGDVTLLALKSQATANLNSQSSDQVNVTATRKLPIWNAVTKAWSAPQPTRSIAWAAAYICKSKFDDSNIDLAWLAQYDAVWAGRGDTFDGGFDSQGGFQSQLNTLLNVGRAQSVMAGGIVSFVRDEPKTVYRCGFSPRNILPDSFSTQYQFFGPDDIDGLLIQYKDSRDWTWHTVLCKLAGSDATVDTAPLLQIVGINNYAQAWREGITKVAASHYRRAFPSFNTELSGRVCFRGDLVKVAHWSANWGASAEAMSLDSSGAHDVITLSEPWTLDADPDGQRIIMIYAPDGQSCGPIPIDVLDDGSTTTLAVVELLANTTPAQGKYAGKRPRAWDVFGNAGRQIARPMVQMGQGTEAPQDALIVSMKPAQSGQAAVAAVIEDARVHTADQGDPPEEEGVDPPDDKDLTVTRLLVQETLSEELDGKNVYVTVTVGGAADAATFDYQTKWHGADGWTNVQPDNARVFQFHSYKGKVRLRVRAVDGSGIPGNWYEQDFVADGKIDLSFSTLDFSQSVNAVNVTMLQGMWG